MGNAKDNLTFTNATDLALNIELAKMGVRCVSGTTPEVCMIDQITETNKYKKNTDTETKKPDKLCFRYGLRDHSSDTCIHKISECYYCKRTGHIRANCFALAKTEKENKKHNDVNTANLEGEGKDDYNLDTLYGRTQSSITTYVSMSVKNIAFEIDTGAAVSLINKVTFDEHYSDIAKPTLDVYIF